MPVDPTQPRDEQIVAILTNAVEEFGGPDTYMGRLFAASAASAREDVAARQARTTGEKS